MRPQRITSSQIPVRANASGTYKKRPHPVKGRSLIRCTTCYIIRACVRIPASSAVFLCSVLWRGLLFHVCSWRTILCICRYMFPVTEEIRQFLLDHYLYLRYSSRLRRTTSELKLRSDVPSYLLAPGSHHPRFAASFPYGLLSPSQLFLYTLSIIGWGKSICQVFSGIFYSLHGIHIRISPYSRLSHAKYGIRRTGILFFFSPVKD